MEKASDLEQALARSKSYVTAAVITLIAYWLFWLPGLIFNIMYINDAKKNEQLAGISLPGVGCLQALLVLGIVLPIVAVVIFIILPWLLAPAIGNVFSGITNSL